MKLFLDADDYYRGIFSLYEFNTTTPIIIRERRKIRRRLKEAGEAQQDTREKLIELLGFCFMPNHLHLLIRQKVHDGITRFMMKMGTGYAGYLNRKYERKGYVFQDRFHARHIENDDQLRVAWTYIHANPISLIEPGWKDHGIKNPDQVLSFLKNYKWSSYQDYIGGKNFPSVTDREFMHEIMGGEQECSNWIENWVRYKADFQGLADLFRE